MSSPYEEFHMLGEDELALLTIRFERMHENRVNSRRNSRTCFRCGKQGHFIADYKHRPRIENKHCSRCDHNHKHRNKDKRRWRKDGHCKKARVMVKASDVNSSSDYSASISSSSEDEGEQEQEGVQEHECV
jgi:hypothetical protein